MQTTIEDKETAAGPDLVFAPAPVRAERRYWRTQLYKAYLNLGLCSEKAWEAAVEDYLCLAGPTAQQEK
jgi:hypothetical protein